MVNMMWLVTYLNGRLMVLPPKDAINAEGGTGGGKAPTPAAYPAYPFGFRAYRFEQQWECVHTYRIR